MLTSLSVDEILLLRYMNWFTNFRGLPLKVEMAPRLKHMNSWLLVSSLSPRSLHLLFCCILSIFTLIWLVLIAFLSTAIRKDSVSPLRFLFRTPCSDLLVKKFHLFVAWNIDYSCFSSHFCFLVFVILFVLMLLVLLLAALILCSFLYNLRVLIWMHLCYLQWWWILFLLLFLTHRVCLCYIYKNLFITENKINHVRLLILARVEKEEMNLDNKTPKAVSYHSSTAITNPQCELGARLSRQEKVLPAVQFGHLLLEYWKVSK